MLHCRAPYVQYVSISVPSATSVAASCTFTVRRRCEDGCPVVRVNTPGLLQALTINNLTFTYLLISQPYNVSVMTVV